MAATRAVLSYDDITEPGPSLSTPLDASRNVVPLDNSPAKRPRWTKTNPRGPPAKRARLHAEAHWDASVEPASIVSYDPIDSTIPPSSSLSNHTLTTSGPSKASTSQKKNVHGNSKTDQQRHDTASVPLGDNDAWDDSSLIQAWEAANEEYERLNGPGKSWKDEPVVKSSLWYGTSSTSKSKVAPPVYEESIEREYYEEAEEEGRLDDEGLEELADKVTPTFPDVTQFSQDASSYTTQEVFQQALNSAWWLGYWTAMHQMKASSSQAEEEI